jgi:hypothetical protein
MAFAFSGCEEDEPDIDSWIIGKWEISSVTITYFIGNIQINQQIETFAPGEMAVELIEGGTGYLYEEGIQTGTFDWSLDGKWLTFPPPDMDPVDGKVKFINKNRLKVTWEEEEMEGDILTIIKYRIDAIRTS